MTIENQTRAMGPLRAQSLKDVFIQRFEELILSGELAIEQSLPPERVLARQLGVSRPVVHEGLVELAARGLVTMKPRVGTVVNDYRQCGSLTLLQSLVSYGGGGLEPQLLDGLLSLRRVIEVETARLAARQRSASDLEALRNIVARELTLSPHDVDGIVDLDFRFHHAIALASGNPLYPMLVKSFEPAQKNLAARFFAAAAVLPRVVRFHAELVAAVSDRDGDHAAAVMTRLLDHGRSVLRRSRTPRRGRADLNSGNGRKPKR